MNPSRKFQNRSRLFVAALSLIWMLVVLLDHQVRVTWFIRSLENFHHGGLLIALLLLYGIFLFSRARISRKGKIIIRASNGWILLLVWFLTAIIFFAGVSIQAEYLDDPVRGTLFFAGRYLLLTVVLIFIMSSAYSYGILLLRGLRLNLSQSNERLPAIALGFALMGLLFFFLAAIGHFTFYPLLLVFLLPLPFGAIDSYRLLKSLLLEPHKEFDFSITGILASIVIIFLTAANFTSMIRPVPIGFDASNLYLNIPHLLSEKGALLQGGQAYNWSLIMASGLTIFKSTPVALLLSILPGILGLLAVKRILRQVGVRSNAALIAAAAFYSLPMVMWQSTQEAKVDLAQLFLGLAALIVFSEWVRYFQKSRPSLSSWWQFPGEMLRYWVVIGVLSGFAIGIKYTALFSIIGILVALAYRLKGKAYGWLGIFASMAAVFGLGLYKLTSIGITLGLAFQTAGILLVPGVLLFLYEWRKSKSSLAIPLKPFMLYAFFTFLVFLPWLGKNYMETGSTSLKTLISGAPLFPTIEPARSSGEVLLPPATLKKFGFIHSVNPHLLAQNGKSAPATTREIRKKKQLESGIYEEVARYVGYEPLFLRYLSIPYDISMQANVPAFANGIGFLFLMLLPLLIFRIPRQPGDVLRESGKFFLLFIWLAMSVYGAYLNSHANDPNAYLNALYQSQPASAGWHKLHAFIFKPLLQMASKFSFLENMTDPRIAFLLIALAPVAFFYLIRKQVSGSSVSSAKWLAVFTAGAFMIWLLMGSGISWYGIVILATAMGLIFYYINAESGVFSIRLVKNAAYGAVSLWFIMVLVLRLTVFNPAGTYSLKAQPLDPDFSRFAAGEISEEEVLEAKIPEYLPTLAILNADSNLDYRILRFGTFMQYFIRNNNERVIIDNQLNVFKFMYDEAGGNASEVYRMMKEEHIRFIIFSAHIGGYTEENLMLEKGRAFQDFVRQLYGMEERPIRLIYPQKIDRNVQADYFAYELLFEKS